MESPVSAAWQSCLSRGGAELTPHLIELATASRDQGRILKKIVAENCHSLNEFTFVDHLPWDFITHSAGPEFLKREFSAYQAGVSSDGT